MKEQQWTRHNKRQGGLGVMRFTSPFLLRTITLCNLRCFGIKIFVVVVVVDDVVQEERPSSQPSYQTAEATDG